MEEPAEGLLWLKLAGAGIMGLCVLPAAVTYSPPVSLFDISCLT